MRFLFINIQIIFWLTASAQIDSVDIKNYYYRYMKNGLAAYQKGDIKDALYFYETAHKTLPKDSAALLNIMHIHLDEKNYKAALATSEKLININYQTPAIFSLNASIKLNEGKINDAIQWVNKGLVKHPANKMLLLLKSNLELDDNREKDAIATIKEIIAVTNEKHYYCNIGLLYENIQENDSAIAAYKLCLTFIPDNIEALHGLAFLYFSKGEALQNEAHEIPLEQIEQYKIVMQHVKILFQEAKNHTDTALKVAPKNEPIKKLSLQIERKLLEL